MKTNMGKDVLKFGDIEIEKQKFHSSKKGIRINKVDTYKTIISKRFTYGNNGSFLIEDTKLLLKYKEIIQ